MPTNGNEYQAFDINSLPLSSLLVDHQHQQQDMSCLLNPPGVGTHGTSGGQSSEILVAPYSSSDLGPSSLFLQQQQQRQQQQQQQRKQQQQKTPALASQRTPILASQQHLPLPGVQQPLHYPSAMTVNNNSNINNNNSIHPFDSSSSFSSAIAQHNLHHQPHPHQQQHPHKPPEMRHFYETVHTPLQGQEIQRQQQEQEQLLQQQQQLQLQLQQLESQMVYRRDDSATSTFTSAVPVPSSQGASSSSTYVSPPNQVSAYEPHSCNLNPNAVLTIPVPSGSPSSPEADLSTRPSSAGVSTPQAHLVPGSNHRQQISTGSDAFSNEYILPVEQQLLAAAMDVKDFQFHFQDLKQIQTHNQTQTLDQQLFQEQLDELLKEQAQALAQSHQQVPAQTQAQSQVQAQVASPQACPENGDSPMDESDVGTRPTFYPGTIHQEQLRNYRGYRHYSYDQNGAPQPAVSNQGGNGYSSSSSSSLASSSSAQQQQQFAVGQKQLSVGLPLPRVDSSHSSSISPGTKESLTQAQMHPPPIQMTASHSGLSDGPGIGKTLATQIHAPPLQVDTSHDSLEPGISTGTGTPQSSFAALTYIQRPLATAPSASASAASSIVGTPTEFDNLQLSSNLPFGSNSSTEQQQLSNHNNGILNIVGTNNCQPTHLPPPFPQEQVIYYGFSFEPVEGFTRQSSWPALVSGVPLTATGSANRVADREMKEFLDSVGGDIKCATAQLDLYGGMSISDAFLSPKIDPRCGLTTGVSDTGTGRMVDAKIQPGDDVVVVVKREKKSMLDVDFDPAANGDEWKEPDRESHVIPVSVRRAAAVAARAAAITARESTINEYINLNVNIDVKAQGGNKNGRGLKRRSRDNVVASQGNNSRSNSSENPHPHDHRESAADVNDTGDDEYIPFPPLSPTPLSPTRSVFTPTPRNNTRTSRVPKKGAIQKTTSPTPEPTVFKCEIPHCEKEFSTYGLLKSHKVSHDPEKPYWCDICSEDGITPRPVDPTPLYPGMPIPIPEVKKYKRHHDLLRHKREQHPPLAVKIQRFREKMEAKEARRVKAEETRKVKAALKRAEKAAAQVTNPTTASRRRPSSAVTVTAASRRRTSSAATANATGAPRGPRASSTTVVIATTETAPVFVAAPAVPEAPKTPRKRKFTGNKQSTTNDDDEDEADNDNDNDSDYQENTKKRPRSKTSSTSRTTPVTPRRRRSSVVQTQPQQPQYDYEQARL